MFLDPKELFFFFFFFFYAKGPGFKMFNLLHSEKPLISGNPKYLHLRFIILQRVVFRFF